MTVKDFLQNLVEAMPARGLDGVELLVEDLNDENKQLGIVGARRGQGNKTVILLKEQGYNPPTARDFLSGFVAALPDASAHTAEVVAELQNQDEGVTYDITGMDNWGNNDMLCIQISPMR